MKSGLVFALPEPRLGRRDEQLTRWPRKYLVGVDSLAGSRSGWATPPRSLPRPDPCAAP